MCQMTINTGVHTFLLIFCMAVCISAPFGEYIPPLISCESVVLARYTVCTAKEHLTVAETMPFFSYLHVDCSELTLAIALKLN